MFLQAAPALELASEEQGLAELIAVTGDRTMAESNAADSDSAQFPLPSGQDSTAGETLLPLWQMLWGDNSIAACCHGPQGRPVLWVRGLGHHIQLC